MFSESQKQTLLKSKFRTTPRYIRVPIQMVNDVRDLKTDVNSMAIRHKFNSSMALLERYDDQHPIYHISADTDARQWLPSYEKICCAYRVLNNSRILRRMKITGFRIVNFTRRAFGWNIASDHYISSLDSASIVLDSLANLFLPSGRVTVTIQFSGGFQVLQRMRGGIMSHACWNGASWRIADARHINNKEFELTITADLAQIVLACNVAMEVAGPLFRSLKFRAFGLKMDLVTDYEPIAKRHMHDDINVILSGYRIRRFQKIGQLTKMF